MYVNRETEQLFVNIVKSGKYNITKEGKAFNTETGNEIGRSINGGYRDIKYGRNKVMRLHRLVYLIHIGEIPDGYVVNHKDRNKLNNNVKNLEAITHTDNMKHVIKLGKNPSITIKNIEEIPLKNNPVVNLNDVSGKNYYFLQIVYDGIIRCMKDGRIYRYDTNNWIGNGISGGYKTIKFKTKSILVHRLIYLVFNGLIPNMINHKDGNKLNNHKDNLETITNAGNVQDAYDTGLTKPRKGEQINTSKLTENDVRQIRLLRDQYSCKELGEMFNVNRVSIQGILNNKYWKHVQ